MVNVKINVQILRYNSKKILLNVCYPFFLLSFFFSFFQDYIAWYRYIEQIFSTRVGMSAFKNVFFQELMSTYCIVALSSIIYGFLQPVSTTYAKSCMHKIRYCGHSGTSGIVNRTSSDFMPYTVFIYSYYYYWCKCDWTEVGVVSSIQLYSFLPFTKLKRWPFNKINIVDYLIFSLCIHSVEKVGFTSFRCWNISPAVLLCFIYPPATSFIWWRENGHL